MECGNWLQLHTYKTKKGALMQVMDKIIITIEPSGCRWGKVGRPGKCINTLGWPAGSQN